MLVWLGTCERDQNLLQGLFDKVTKKIKFSDSDGKEPGDFLLHTPQELDAFEDFCNRPYWNRIWTVQERALAAKITIACGSMRIDWSIMSKLARHNGDMFVKNHCRLNRIFRASSVIDASYLLDSHGGRLEDLIFQHQKRQATDPRDRVFALLALADPPSPIVADYSMPAIQLYRDVLRLKYPGGTSDGARDPAVVVGTLPAILELDRESEEYEAVIREFFPDGWSSSWDKVIAQHFQ